MEHVIRALRRRRSRCYAMNWQKRGQNIANLRLLSYLIACQKLITSPWMWNRGTNNSSRRRSGSNSSAGSRNCSAPGNYRYVDITRISNRSMLPSHSALTTPSFHFSRIQSVLLCFSLSVRVCRYGRTYVRIGVCEYTVRALFH